MAVNGQSFRLVGVRARVQPMLGSPALLLALAIVFGAVLRFATLGQQSLDEDETVTVWLLHLPLHTMLATIPRTESTPPLYYLLAWPWSRAFGAGAVGLRLLSASLGVVTIGICYLAAQALLNRRAGAIAALLAALSPALIWYSQEARANELLMLTSALALLFFTRSTDNLRAGSAPAWNLGLWALAASLSLLSHYFAAFLLVPQALWLLVEGRRARRHAPLASVAAVALVGLALVPLIARQRANRGSSWIASVPLGGRLEDVAPQMLLGEGRPFFHFFALGVGLLVVAPVVVLLARGGPAQRRAVLIPILIGACGVLLPALVDLAGMHILVDRNTVGAGTVLLIGCAVGMAASRPAWLGLGALIGVGTLFALALALVLSNPLHQREDWRDAARALGLPTVARAVLYGPATNNPSPVPPLVPFQAVYLKGMLTMPDSGLSVREVDVLNVRDDLSDTSPPPAPVSPGHGFKLVARVGTRPYTLFRFRSPRLVHVTPDELIGDELLTNRDEGDTLVGLQLPRKPAGSDSPSRAGARGGHRVGGGPGDSGL
jgi:4-amino-4-deoxy-L-arabinose transferase-like glycosyltransferase